MKPEAVKRRVLEAKTGSDIDDLVDELLEEGIMLGAKHNKLDWLSRVPKQDSVLANYITELMQIQSGARVVRSEEPLHWVTEYVESVLITGHQNDLEFLIDPAIPVQIMSRLLAKARVRVYMFALYNTLPIDEVLFGVVRLMERWVEDQCSFLGLLKSLNEVKMPKNASIVPRRFGLSMVDVMKEHDAIERAYQARLRTVRGQ